MKNQLMFEIINTEQRLEDIEPILGFPKSIGLIHRPVLPVWFAGLRRSQSLAPRSVETSKLNPQTNPQLHQQNVTSKNIISNKLGQFI